MTWLGIYGFGFVLAILGWVWRPEYTMNWVASALLMLLASLFSFLFRQTALKTHFLRDQSQPPQPLYRSQDG